MAKSMTKKALRKPARAKIKARPAATKAVSRRTSKGLSPARHDRKPAAVAKAAKNRKLLPQMKAKDNNGDRPVQPVKPAGPVKNQAGLNSRELEHYRELLLGKRRELVGDMSSMRTEALDREGSGNLSNLPIHMADMGTDNYEQEFTLGLMEKDRLLLREIDSALVKMREGTYGVCEGTGKPIAKARLEAQPWARFSIEWARKMEKGPIR